MKLMNRIKRNKIKKELVNSLQTSILLKMETNRIINEKKITNTDSVILINELIDGLISNLKIDEKFENLFTLIVR